MKAARVVEAVLLQTPLRLALGGIFCVAAVSKLQDPQSFAFAIKGFKVFDPVANGPVIVTAAFTIPWVELVAGVALILGLWTRAAALTLALALLAFIGGLLSVIARKLDASCSCFGNLNLFCGHAVGWCQVIRNVIMLVPAVYLVWRGGGLAAIDRLLDRGREHGQAPEAPFPAASVPPNIPQYDPPRPTRTRDPLDEVRGRA